MEINNSTEAVGEGYRKINQIRKVSETSKWISETTTDKINDLAKNYAKLHKLFVDFNEIYAKYVMLILGLCFATDVFEVNILLLNPLIPNMQFRFPKLFH